METIARLWGRAMGILCESRFYNIIRFCCYESKIIELGLKKNPVLSSVE